MQEFNAVIKDVKQNLAGANSLNFDLGKLEQLQTQTTKQLNDAMSSNFGEAIKDNATQQIEVLRAQKENYIKEFSDLAELFKQGATLKNTAVSEISGSSSGNNFKEEIQAVNELKEALSSLNTTKVDSEPGDLNGLREKVEAVTKAVQEKTQAFEAEATAVKTNVDSEKADLDALKDTIDGVKRSASKMLSGAKFTKGNVTNLDTIIRCLQNLDIDVSDEETNNLNNITTSLNSLSSLKPTNAKSLESLINSLKSLGDAKINVESLSALSNIDLSSLQSLSGIKGVSAKSLQSVATGLSSLSSIDFSKFSAFSELDFFPLEQLADIKGVSAKSLEALATGLEKLTKLDYSAFEHLRGVDLSNFGNLKYTGQASKVLLSESKDFIKSQEKQIDSALNSYRERGLSEDQLQELKNLRTLLNSEFTPEGLSQMTDIKGNTSVFVQNLADAIDKCDRLAESLHKDEESAAGYSAALNKIASLQRKTLNGTMTGDDYYQLKKATEKADKIEKENSGIDTKRRDIIRNDYSDLYANKVDHVLSSIKDIYDNSQDTDFLNNYRESLKSILDEGEDLKSASKTGLLDEEGLRTNRDNLEQLQQKVKDTAASLNNMKVTNSKGTFLTKLTSGATQQGIEELKNYLTAQEQAKGNKIQFNQVGNDYSSLKYSVTTQAGELQNYVASINSADNSVRALMKSESEYTSFSTRFTNSIKGKFAELTRYITVMNVFQKSLTFVKQGLQAVRDIDDAMTELKKVTDDTETSYSKFQDTAVKTAKEVGGSVSDIINSSADFSRAGLGKNLEEVSKYAKDATLLKNVSEYENISDATNALIAMKQAYQDVGTSEIVDKLNSIGNT